MQKTPVISITQLHYFALVLYVLVGLILLILLTFALLFHVVKPGLISIIFNKAFIWSKAMSRCSLAFLFTLISMANSAFSDEVSEVPNKAQTNNILEQTKQKLDHANQIEKDNFEKGIQQGEGQSDKSN